MSDMTFNTAAGKTVERELLIACLNTATTSAPVWSPIGLRVNNSSEEINYNVESEPDILGNVNNTVKKPIITQSFDPMPLDGGDAAGVKIWNMGIKDQDYSALASQDMLIVHKYAGTADTAFFAERYSACAVVPTGLGGEGGGNVTMPVDVTYGGIRTIGTAAMSTVGIIFTPGS